MHKTICVITYAFPLHKLTVSVKVAPACILYPWSVLFFPGSTITDILFKVRAWTSWKWMYYIILLSLQIASYQFHNITPVNIYQMTIKMAMLSKFRLGQVLWGELVEGAVILWTSCYSHFQHDLSWTWYWFDLNLFENKVQYLIVQNWNIFLFLWFLLMLL